jgi:predicted phage tail protein
MKRKVYLEGEIGYRFGKEFEMAADSFSDVFRCLKCNFDGFMPYLQECHEKNIGFLLEVEGKHIKSEAEALLLYKEGDMIITSVPAGSKSGPGKILAAIAVTVMTGGMAAFAAAGSAAFTTAAGTMTLGSVASGVAGGIVSASGSILGQMALGLGVNLALGGLQQMMAPDPSTDNEQDESYIFQGSKQNIAEGDPVPVLYGELRIPGRTVSFHTRSERTQFANFSQRATSSESNGNGYDSQNPGTTGGGAGGASAPMGGSGTIDYSLVATQLEDV